MRGGEKGSKKVWMLYRKEMWIEDKEGRVDVDGRKRDGMVEESVELDGRNERWKTYRLGGGKCGVVDCKCGGKEVWSCGS